jgi:hypothetical protein
MHKTAAVEAGWRFNRVPKWRIFRITSSIRRLCLFGMQVGLIIRTKKSKQRMATMEAKAGLIGRGRRPYATMLSAYSALDGFRDMRDASHMEKDSEKLPNKQKGCVCGLKIRRRAKCWIDKSQRQRPETAPVASSRFRIASHTVAPLGSGNSPVPRLP